MPVQFEKEPSSPKTPKEVPLKKEPQESQVEIEKDLEELEKNISREEKKAVPAAGTPTSTAPAATLPRIQKSEARKQIEHILSEDLADIFRSMDENQKQIFKQKGEDTARAIEVLVQTAKVTAKKIVQLIGEWLKLIPGVNKFFLEQETKIKTDKVLEMTYKKEE